MEYSVNKSIIGNQALLETLRVISAEYEKLDAELYVVGATARDLALNILKVESAPRKTLDLDVAILLENWAEYGKLTDILLHDGFEKAPEQQKFFFQTSYNIKYEIDIVPFGDIAENEQIAWPPEGNPVMSVKCFGDVMHCSDIISIDNEFKFRIASLSGQWLIKLDTWRDRHLKTRKDAADLQFILENAYVAFALSANAIPEEISTDAKNFDITVAGAEWIAADLKRILSQEHKTQYASFIENELSLEDRSLLINDLLDYARTSAYDSIRRALFRMTQILR